VIIVEDGDFHDFFESMMSELIRYSYEGVMDAPEVFSPDPCQRRPYPPY